MYGFAPHLLYMETRQFLLYFMQFQLHTSAEWCIGTVVYIQCTMHSYSSTNQVEYYYNIAACQLQPGILIY